VRNAGWKIPKIADPDVVDEIAAVGVGPPRPGRLGSGMGSTFCASARVAAVSKLPAAATPSMFRREIEFETGVMSSSTAPQTLEPATIMPFSEITRQQVPNDLVA